MSRHKLKTHITETLKQAGLQDDNANSPPTMRRSTLVECLVECFETCNYDHSAKKPVHFKPKSDNKRWLPESSDSDQATDSKGENKSPPEDAPSFVYRTCKVPLIPERMITRRGVEDFGMNSRWLVASLKQLKDDGVLIQVPLVSMSFGLLTLPSLVAQGWRDSVDTVVKKAKRSQPPKQKKRKLEESVYWDPSKLKGSREIIESSDESDSRQSRKQNSSVDQDMLDRALVRFERHLEQGKGFNLDSTVLSEWLQEPDMSAETERVLFSAGVLRSTPGSLHLSLPSLGAVSQALNRGHTWLVNTLHKYVTVSLTLGQVFPLRTRFHELPTGEVLKRAGSDSRLPAGEIGGDLLSVLSFFVSRSVTADAIILAIFDVRGERSG